MDRCGICGGDNSTCETKRIANSFNRVVYGYNIVHRFPVGARNIKVKQIGHLNMKEDETYLGIFYDKIFFFELKTIRLRSFL